MTNEQRAVDALEKIEKVLDGVKDLFPLAKMKGIKISESARSKAFVMLKRISAIIVNYNESNAELKLKNVMGLLGALPKEKK